MHLCQFRHPVAAVRGICDVAIWPDKRDPPAWRGPHFNDIGKCAGELLRGFSGRRLRFITQHEKKAAENALAAAHRIIEVALSRSLDNRAFGIGHAKFRKPFDESVLKRRETRHHRYHRVSKRLCKPARSSHYLGQKIGGPDHVLDYRKAFGAIAVEQLLVAAAVQIKVKLPDQIPNIMQPGIHALPAERAVNMSSIPSDKKTSDPQQRRVPMMNAKIAGPVKRAYLDPAGGALRQHVLHKFHRRGIPFRVVDGRDDAATRGAHWKNRYRAQFTGAKLHLVRGKSFIGLDVRQHERGLIFPSLKRQLQHPADRAVSTIATDYKRSSELHRFALVVQGDAHTPFLLLG